MSCANCGNGFDGRGYGAGRFCSRRCYCTAWTRMKRQEDPQAYREEMRTRRSDPAFMERQRESNRHHAERNRARIASRQREWAGANRQKANAEKTARRAVKTGRLIREPCLFCDDPKTHGHHHDYSQPLTVTWLCPTHHGLVHRKESHVYG